ncbi:hypothetical protein [Parapedobacter sp. DT-150]|uniref:hypothetical protein n=1 Tax=Parapedobacter sp. DT-150 TaxID=3396162 RepID=UPI003F1B0689
MRENHAFGARTPRVRRARWENTGRRKSGIGVPVQKGQPFPCSRPLSLTLPSPYPSLGPYPHIPRMSLGRSAHSRTLAKGKRQRDKGAYRGGMEWGGAML